MRRKKVFWLRVSRPLVYTFVLGFGLLGLVLSLQRIAPTVAVTGGRIGYFLQMLLDMLEFAHLGI